MAAFARQAGVLGAGVVVVAGQRLRAQADTFSAAILGRAGVEVVTWVRVGLEAAARRRITPVIGTGIAIDTGKGLAGLAGTLATAVAHGADISVITGVQVGGKNAASDPITTVCGAQLPVVARNRRGSAALALGAGIARGTCIAIVAGRDVGLVDATAVGAASVRGAGLPVVANDRQMDAVAVGARVVGTWVEVAAGHVLDQAGSVYQAGLDGAGVQIVTDRGLGIVQVHASNRLIAAIHGTWVLVVAIGWIAR